jgi:hypothetical protein
LENDHRFHGISLVQISSKNLVFSKHFLGISQQFLMIMLQDDKRHCQEGFYPEAWDSLENWRILAYHDTTIPTLLF